MERSDKKDPVKLLTKKNRKELVWAIDLIIERYAFSDSNAVSVFVNNLNELDKLLKFLKVAEQLHLAQSLLDTTSKSEKPYPMMFVIRVKYDELLKFKRTLTDSDDPDVATNSSQESKNVPAKADTDQAPDKRAKVEQRSYDHANGILTISGRQVRIIKQPNQKGWKSESREARLMRLLFKDVNSNFGTTPMRSVVSVRAYDFKPKHRKLVKSYASEINRKIHQETGIKEFLLTNQYAVMINELYLK